MRKQKQEPENFVDYCSSISILNCGVCDQQIVGDDGDNFHTALKAIKSGWVAVKHQHFNEILCQKCKKRMI